MQKNVKEHKETQRTQWEHKVRESRAKVSEAWEGARL